MTNVFFNKVTQLRPELQSKVIEFLRFPLIVLIVFFHNTVIVGNVDYDVSTMDMPFFYWCSSLFRGPFAFRNQCFFFISGFLFFQNVKIFDLLTYKNKIKNRVNSLLIPYLFWNAAVIALYVFISMIPQLSNIMNTEIQLHDFFRYFWNQSAEFKSDNVLDAAGGGIGKPAVIQFWFVRDLMMAVLLAPVIYFFCKKAKIYGILLLGILWYFDWWYELDGFSSMCIFFFTAGAYFGINKRNLIVDFGKIRNLSFVLFPSIAVVDLLTMEYDFNHYVHQAEIIVAIIFCFNFVAYLFEKGAIKPTKFLAAASFFLFATHVPFLLDTFRKLTYIIFRPESDWASITFFFVNVILTVLSALGLYYILRRYLPRFTRIITGGR